MNRSRAGEVIRFCIVGGIATIIHYTVYGLLMHITGYNVAYTVGYGVSFLANYLLSSVFTFRVGLSLGRAGGFALSHLINYLLQIVLLNGAIYVGISDKVAPLPVFLIVIPINFFVVRHFLTRQSRPSDSYLIMCIVIALAMFGLLLNDAPTLSDDMIYRFMWQNDDDAPVQSINTLGDLLRSQWTHYITTNGRFPVHLLAQAALVFVPSVLLQVLNSLLFVLLLHQVGLWVCMGKENSQRIFVVITATFLLFAVFSGFRTAILWGLGAFNYLWVLVANMAFVLYVRRATDNNTIDTPAASCASKRVGVTGWLILPLALLAGWSHEAIAIPLCVAFFAMLIYNVKRDGMHRMACSNDQIRLILSLLCYMAGASLCVLSPGIWQRASGDITLQSRLVSGAVNAVSNVRVTWLLLLTLVAVWRFDRELLNRHLRRNIYPYITLAAAMGIVLLCGTNLERVAFFADFIAMLLWLSLLVDIVSPQWKRWLLIGFSVAVIVLYVPAFQLRQQNDAVWQGMRQQMEASVQKGLSVQIISADVPKEGDSRLTDWLRHRYVNPTVEFGFYCSYMGFDSNDINMRCAARLFGKERLTFLPADVVRRIEADSTAYANYELDANGQLFVWQLRDKRSVTAVTFVLDKEDLSQLKPWQRLVAWHEDTYELDDFNYEVVSICGRRYLIFTRPTTNVYRRINHVELTYGSTIDI